MKVKDIMSKQLISCNVDDNVLFVSNLMKVCDVGFILITDKNKLYGVITDRDIVCDLPQGSKPIKEFARTNIISADENEDVLKALNIMKENRIKRLVVTNDKKIVGVLSLSDIFTTDIKAETILEALREIYAIDRNDEDFDTDVDDFIL